MSLRWFATHLVSELHSWLSAVFHRNRLEERMDFELAWHLELLTRDLTYSGFSPEEAARRTRIAPSSVLSRRRRPGGANITASESPVLLAAVTAVLGVCANAQRRNEDASSPASAPKGPIARFCPTMGNA